MTIALTGAAFARGSSKQDYETPKEFLDAVRHHFSVPMFERDLAATVANAKAPKFYTEQDDALVQNWSRDTAGDCWLNPPFGDIAPWACKCAEHSKDGRRRIFLLVPASVGSNWFAQHVHPWAMVYALNGRITFVGAKEPFPKDCLLCVYGGPVGFDVWRWRP